MAQDCLSILNRKPFFKALVTQSSNLAWRAKLKANLGCESFQGDVNQANASSTEEDIASETTRETRNSAVSNEFGPLPFSTSSQGPLDGEVPSQNKVDLSLSDNTKQKEAESEQHIEETKEIQDVQALHVETKTNSSIEISPITNTQSRNQGLLSRMQHLLISMTQYQFSNRAIRWMLTIVIFVASQIVSCLLLNRARKYLFEPLNFKNLTRIFSAAFQLAIKFLPKVIRDFLQ